MNNFKMYLLFISSLEIKLEATENGKVRVLEPVNNYPRPQEDVVNYSSNSPLNGAFLKQMLEEWKACLFVMIQ